MTPSRTIADPSSPPPQARPDVASSTVPESTATTGTAPRSEGRGGSPYLTTDEAAAYLRTTRGTVYNLVWRGVLPRRRGKLLFTRQELDEYLAGKKATPSPRRSTTPRGETSHRR